MTSVDTFPARFGPFVLLRCLGAGGMGSAYLARHPDLSGLLVVKRLHPQLMLDSTIFKRFVHEAEVAAHVRHPNVAGVVAMGTVDNEPFLATEYVFGIPVADIVLRIEDSLVDAVPLDVGLALGIEMMRGLEGIHRATHRKTGEALGLIHRDIGARNVLVGFDGHVRIIDLGLGKSTLSDWQTNYQQLAGSPDYMSPEQAMGAQVDGRADVYAAAVTLWELLAGRKRIRTDSVGERIKLAVGAQPEPLLDVRPEASPRLEAILKQAMIPDPDQRTPTVEILRQTLDEERRALPTRAGTPDVVAWLDTACATIIARERRLLEDAKGLERRSTRPVRAETKFFVQQELVQGSKDPYAPYSADADPVRTQIGVRAVFDRLAASQVAIRLSEMVEPGKERSGPIGARALLAAFVFAIMVGVAGLTAWLLTPAALVQAEGMIVAPAPVPPGPSHTVAAPVVVDPPPELLDPDPVVEAIDPAVDAAPKPRVRTAKARTKTTRRSKAFVKKKRRLVERLRLLRRQRFEIAYQRRLTRISSRLSKARTVRSLDSISASLTRLEAE